MQDPIEIQNLKQSIQEMRKECWPMIGAEGIDDLPLYFAPSVDVECYLRKWSSLIERAKDLYMPILGESDDFTLPSHLNFPIIYPKVNRIILNKTKAKESKTFRGIASLVEKCGTFPDEQIDVMRQWLESDDTAALVAHREFVDIRAYIFLEGQNDYIRSRFYVNQLLVGTTDKFKIIDNRGKERKERNDSFKNPIGDNENWKVFGKFR